MFYNPFFAGGGGVGKLIYILINVGGLGYVPLQKKKMSGFGL